MFQLSSATQSMAGKLKRNLLKRTCARPQRYRRTDSFKVKEVGWQLMWLQRSGGTLRVEECLSGQGRRLNALLQNAEQFVGHLRQFNDLGVSEMRFQRLLLHFGQPRNWMHCLWLLSCAMVNESAGEWGVAMRTCANVGLGAFARGGLCLGDPARYFFGTLCNLGCDVRLNEHSVVIAATLIHPC